MDLVADLRAIAGMGIGGAASRGPALAAALLSVARATRARAPSAALLVGFSEPNAWLAPRLKARGVRVLWYAPPQTWAWRPGRAPRIARACDELAVVLPFEPSSWLASGARVQYVGHPALGHAFAPARALHDDETLDLALVPGSRSHEVRAHLPLMLGAVERLARDRRVRVRVVSAPGLDVRTAAWLERTATAAGARVTGEPIDAALAGCHSALCASGTATLECTTLGVPPVIVYRTDRVTYAVARHLVRVDHIGLPNLVLGRREFPELVQESATPDAIAAACRGVLAARVRRIDACLAVRAALAPATVGRSATERVASLLHPWLE